MLVFATARHNLAHFDIIRTKMSAIGCSGNCTTRFCDQIKRAQMNVWKCCVFPSSSSAARSEHPQLQQGTVVSCQCTHNQIFISRDEEKREGEEEANMKNTTRQRKRKRSLGTGGVWEKKRQIEKREKAKKILYAVECLSYQGGWLREWAKRIRGHDGENVRRQISQKYKENETEAAAWCGKNKDRRSKRGGRNEERQTGW